MRVFCASLTAGKSTLSDAVHAVRIGNTRLVLSETENGNRRHSLTVLVQLSPYSARSVSSAGLGNYLQDALV